jgi:hypothetical protein
MKEELPSEKRILSLRHRVMAELRAAMGEPETPVRSDHFRLNPVHGANPKASIRRTEDQRSIGAPEAEGIG